MAFGADGAVTHWNREAERLLGWTAAEAVGRQGLAGWAVRKEDADEVEADLLAATRSPGRQVHEFALLTKDGRRGPGAYAVLRRARARRAGGGRAYRALTARCTRRDRPGAFHRAERGALRGRLLGRRAGRRRPAARRRQRRRPRPGDWAVPPSAGCPLGDLLAQGVEELESALTHVLAEGTPPAAAELWVTLRSDEVEQTRRCWRSGFVRLASPLAEEPVPLGVGWIFQDVTDAKRAEQEASLLRFRAQQLHRAGRAAGECEDPMEAAAVHLDFALAGFADHGLIDVVGGGGGGDTGVSAVGPDAAGPPALVRAIASPAGAPGPSEAMPPTGIPVAYGPGHPAAQALERVRLGTGRRGPGDRGGLGRGPQVAGRHGARPVRGAAQPGADAGRGDVPARPLPAPVRPGGRVVRGRRRVPDRGGAGPGGRPRGAGAVGRRTGRYCR
ncbi:PAS domain-containing protein OS=Streptomyces rimosus subsp. rimosus (strain ATCC /DSM 40260 / JCM 4667 / NRRL 2234) OX=1265868 GN=SRIM_024915 PE=4 SV=1 [Streptomyces rimosus subsp. rimosus]